MNAHGYKENNHRNHQNPTMFGSSLRECVLEAKASFLNRVGIPNSGPPNPSMDMELQQSIRNQTHVSTTLASHLLSNKFRNSNVVFSPISIHASLSMVAAGSKGRTLNQLLGFLKAKTTDELGSLSSHTSSILADGSQYGGPRLSFVNGVWVDKTLPLSPSFKKVMNTVFKAACNQVDFQTKAAKVANEVNQWAEKHTNGIIKQLLPVDAVNSMTELIFANAVYFKGAWSQKFDRSMTEESDFHLLDKNKVKVPFMTSMEKQFVQEYDGFKALGLPYSQGQDKRQFTMYFFLPNAKDGLQSLVEKMGSTSDFLDHHIPREKTELGRFLIPKFKISSNFEASHMLKDLGLVLPFSDEADFTKMVDLPSSESLGVSAVHHVSFVEVNEEGTEAAAATATIEVGCPLMTMPKDMVDFVADHPFLFVIREDVTGSVLYMGQVVNPLAG